MHTLLVQSRLTLSLQLHFLIQARLASTGTSTSIPYPYPTHPCPTPHQIFHLPASASQQDIKARYYDLVRLHHPDSPLCRALCQSHSERQSRFQAIAAAYNALRGHAPLDPFAAEIARRNRAWGNGSTSHQHRRGHDRVYAGVKSSGDDRWKDKMIVIFGILALAAGFVNGLFLLPFSLESRNRRHLAASTNLARARREAREHGDARRKEIERREAALKFEGKTD